MLSECILNVIDKHASMRKGSRKQETVNEALDDNKIIYWYYSTETETLQNSF